MLPPTRTRVEQNTAEHVNERIRRRTVASIERTVQQGSAAIARRLVELEREWDIERTLEANASTIALIGLALGSFVHSYWFALPALVLVFLLLHALQGWCPPVPIFRRLGFRTASEIDAERTALKAIRGDLATQPRDTHVNAESVLATIEA